MSSMKKNVLAVALVAGLGLAGAAAAYTYGTLSQTAPNVDPQSSPANAADLATPENVAYQLLLGPNYNYTMTEDLVFDINPPDNAVQVSTGFTVRVKLNRNNCVASGLPYPQPDTTCADTADGALFAGIAPTAPEMILEPSLAGAGWTVAFDAFYDGNRTASFRIIPPAGNTLNPSAGILLRWRNARLTSLNEFALGAAGGGTDKVDAEFWMVNATNDSRYQGSTTSRTILKRVSGVTACADRTRSEVDKYIDVADDYTEDQLPKTLFSFDGKLGSANDNNLGGSVTAPSDYNSQVINLGDVTINNTGAGNFVFLGSDTFTTTITGNGGDDWNAFDDAGINDRVYLMYGGTDCTNGTLVTLTNAGTGGTVSGNQVSFTYTAAAANLNMATGAFTNRLRVCAFQNTNRVIDDHPNHVNTTFFRAGAIATPAFNDDHANMVCDVLPLRYNGSTMEIFTINPGSNTTQRSFIRLTNRSATDGYVSLEGIDNNGMHGASQVRVWVPAGASVQLNSTDLENGTGGAIGAWGAPSAGKWRAVVTAEFPGLVASSLVNSSLPNVLTNVTDSDTRGEQYLRDYEEGNFSVQAGQRPSDFNQEWTPDFHGNGDSTGEPGGPNGGQAPDGGPSGGQTTPDGNPGL
ncbi:hypothetical protein [Thermomonas sp.]|uniref:hypothetical protein n=1 Tax=Thermomonas sp. TaxID=1971895 RepID=UPI003783B007